MEKIFKAKRLDNGEWHVFGLFDIAADATGELLVVDNGEAVLLDKNTICQYTGINDSEGNRIFEGDEIYVSGTVNVIVTLTLTVRGVMFGEEHVSMHLNQRSRRTLTGHNIHDRG